MRLHYNGLATGASGATVGLSLGASLTNVATPVTFNAALTYNNGTAVPTITGTDYIPLSILDANGHVSEIVYLTAYTAAGTTGTITRGQEGTSGVAHSSGDKVAHGVIASDLGWTSLINDDLSTTTNLLTALSGTWAINAGVLRQSNSSGTAQRAHTTAVTPSAVRAVECGMAYISGSGTRRLGLHVSWKNVASNNLFVYLESTNGTTWTLKAEDESVVLLLTSTATISYAGSGYVRLGVIQSGTLLDFYIDGVWVDSLNAISSSQWQSGKYVGLNTQNAVVDFRNLKAWATLSSPF